MLAAVGCAAGFASLAVAQVVQTPKNGCSSPEAYSGTVTSPVFATGSSTTLVNFQGWFEVEAVDPDGHDTVAVEYSIDGVDWNEFGRLNPTSAGGGTPDQGYSNNGLGVAPSFQAYSFPLPTAAANQPAVRIRFSFATFDDSFQGFRGTAVDNVTIPAASPSITQGFESGAAGWTFDAAQGVGAPFWHMVQNPQNIAVKNPEINPTLVTLPDIGALPAAAQGTWVA